MILTLPQRNDAPEIMDGTDFHEGEYERTLRELEWINRFTGGYKPTLEAVMRAHVLAQELGDGAPLRILDIGFGYGDTLREIHKFAREKGIEVVLHGVDLNPSAKRWAESATPRDYGIKFDVGNVFELKPGSYDLIVNALMMHHLTNQEIVEMLKWMTANAKIAWFINDLHRHPLAFHAVRLATRFGDFGRLVKNDAPLSVAKSFTLKDWEGYLAQAGIPRSSVSLRWNWAFRYGVFCHTQEATVKT